jgi:hypothetical protein
MSDDRSGLEFEARAKKLRTPSRVLDVTWSITDERFEAAGTWINFLFGEYARVDFRGQRFDPFHADSSTFADCDFRGIQFRSGTLGIRARNSRQSVYVRCAFDGADLRHVRPGNARFEECTFRGSKLDHWRADDAEFVNCVFSGRMADVRFSGRPRDEYSALTGRVRNTFLGNDLSAAELREVMFVYGIDLRAQRLPQGDSYVRFDHPRERIARARSIIAQWPDPTEREDALFLLRLFSESGYEEQDEIFITAHLPSISDSVSDRVWALVAATDSGDPDPTSRDITRR